MTNSQETIAAIATPIGQAGIGVIRLSGSKALEIFNRLFVPRKDQEWATHRLVLGSIVEPKTGDVIDEVLSAWMKGPHSFTGEDVVEIHGHGNPILLNKILTLVIDEGARLARAGEFSQRAFLSGRIDLVQAEAICELIHSESLEEAKAAKQRLSGALSASLESLYALVLDVLAECEADIDFPDENLPIEQRGPLLKKIKDISTRASELLNSYESNQELHDGMKVVLFGAPNVGKSSLFNRLLSEDRAIVTSIAGTTRDLLREELNLGGRRVRLFDTAGLHEGVKDIVEREGMERSIGVIDAADIVCLILSSEEKLGEMERSWLQKLSSDKLWVVWNKIDLKEPKIEEVLEGRKCFLVSALNGNGIGALREALTNEATRRLTYHQSGGISNERQRQLLLKFKSAFDQGYAAMHDGQFSEFVSFEFRQGLGFIGEILGKADPQEDILDQIFSKFCIGK
ncbi:MAG: tRNA uridine-5-carboxymethylaminomethyl(34) synthesis GTPase MnmE [Bdellovibrionales bacterium]|nr:tRNA uridine-5-carboxymethylaminomethyl(34) synthesis GTPase MnmE [Bdellovibrionales bacterium]